MNKPTSEASSSDTTKEYVDKFITELKDSMSENLEENQPKQPNLVEQSKAATGSQLSLPDYGPRDIRKKISDAALENCAELEWDMHTCLQNGSLLDKFSQCSKQSEAFWQCIRQQKDKLKELGYMNLGNTYNLNLEIQDRAFRTLDSTSEE
ncbi:hypothetical protein K7432_012919 [Basidiobolus ranarum]|uniref:COX assembly mitochondrial protein n=1 Tax=Basidiobolus ranarum TaxID=34480 RepID=A0ABR2WK10_9FUNG